MKIFAIIVFVLFITSCTIEKVENLVDEGHNYECIGEPKKAMRFYNLAILMNKKSALAYWRRGDLYSRKIFDNNYSKAISDLTKSIEIDSTFNGGYAFWSRANCRIEINDTIGALSDYNKAIAISPEKESFYYSRAILKYYRFHDIEGALNDLDTAIKYWNEYDLARQCRAEIKVNLENYKGAMDDYNKLKYPFLDLDSSYADEFYFRGIARFETGNLSEACEDLKKSYKLGFKEAKTKINLICL